MFYEDNIYFDNSDEIRYKLTKSDLNSKNIKNLVSSIGNDTLTWIQENDNSWFTGQDSILIYDNEVNERIIEWYYQKNSKIEERMTSKRKLADEILIELIEIEKTLVYPNGINNITISNCSMSDGTDWYQEMRIGKLKKLYYSIECGNERWINLREKIIGIKE